MKFSLVTPFYNNEKKSNVLKLQLLIKHILSGNGS
jgi:hypothetical protein